MTKELNELLWNRVQDIITADNRDDKETLKALFVCSITDEQGFEKAYNGYKVLDLATAVAAQYKSIYYAGIQGINMEINCDLLQRYKDLGGTADEIKKLIVASEPEGGCLNPNHGSGKRELGFLIDTVQEDLANV